MKTLPLTIIIVGIYSPLLAQEVHVLGATKTRIYRAINNGISEQSEAYEFKAFIEGNNLDESFTIGHLDVPHPAGEQTFDFDDGSFEVEGFFNSETAINSSFPDGAYGFELPGQTVSVILGSSGFPNAPTITSSRGNWEGGCLVLTPEDAAIGFTLNSNTSTAGGFTTLEVYSEDTDTDIADIENTSGGSVSTHINGGLLTDTNYTIELEFDNVTWSNSFTNPSWAPSGGSAFAINSSRLVVPLKIRPAIIDTTVVFTAPKAATISLPTSTGYLYQFKCSTNLTSSVILETRPGSGNSEDFSYSGSDPKAFYWLDTIKAPAPATFISGQSITLHSTEFSEPPLTLSADSTTQLTAYWGTDGDHELDELSYSYTNPSGAPTLNVTYPESTLSNSSILSELNAAFSTPGSPFANALDDIIALGGADPTEAQLEALVEAAYDLPGDYALDYDSDDYVFIVRSLTSSLNSNCTGTLTIGGPGITLSGDNSSLILSGSSHSYTDNVVGFFE